MTLPNFRGRVAWVFDEPDYDIDLIIGVSNIKITDVKEVEIKEREGLTTRNSMGALAYKDRVVLFAGQDSEKGVLYNDLFTIDSTFKV